MQRIDFLGCPMDATTMAETVEAIDSAVASGRFLQHVVVNVAKLVNMRRDISIDVSIRECDIINIDGMGVVLGARFMGHNVPERVSGVDLFYNLMTLSAEKGYSIFLLGAEDSIVKSTASKIQALYPRLKIAGYHHGFFWEDEEAVVERISRSGAQLLFVAITSPKKEKFINRWRERLGVTFVMGVGGTFDVVAGKVSRAPKWMQKAGLEWFYRIIQEPIRMWKRYLVTNTRYALLLIREKVILLIKKQKNSV